MFTEIALKKIYRQIQNYNFKKHYYLGVKIFWSVQNNQSVIDTINKLNSKYKATSFSTFDFSTLYTNTPHYPISICFNSGDKEFTGIIRYGAPWINSQENYSLSFNKTS